MIESVVNTLLLALMAITVVSLAGLTNLFSVVMLSSLFSFLMATVFVTLDAVDVSIRSTDIIAKPIIEYVPVLDSASSPSFDFGASLNKPYAFDSTTGFSAFTPAITSTQFVVDNTSVSINDDGLGNLMLVTQVTNVPTVFKPSVGTIDYTTGVAKLSNLKVSSFTGNAIKLTVSTLSKDIRPPKDRIITVRAEDITITATPLAV